MTTITLYDEYSRPLIQCQQFQIAGFSWHPVPGIYGFARPGFGHWLCYIGQAFNFQDRHRSHHVYDEAMKAGCTHYIAAVVHGEDERDRLEQAIYDAYRPMLNKVRPSAILGAGTRAIFGMPPRAPNPAIFTPPRTLATKTLTPNYGELLARALTPPAKTNTSALSGLLKIR